MDLLIQNIERFVKLTEEEKETFKSSFTKEFYKAKTVLLKEGEICKKHMFINSGILRQYTVNDNFDEHTLSFSSTDWWAGEMYSFLSQKPGYSYIEVIEDAEVLLQSREDQLQMFDKIPKIERFSRIQIERSLVANQERLIDNMRLTAEERYEKFLNKFTAIEYRLPQKDIASYLGITPQFFSKMKGRYLRNR